MVTGFGTTTCIFYVDRDWNGRCCQRRSPRFVRSKMKEADMATFDFATGSPRITSRPAVATRVA
ncbi:MAG: hypothetical protein E5W25_36010, partial [Mesorhizobium sp.]